MGTTDLAAVGRSGCCRRVRPQVYEVSRALRTQEGPGRPRPRLSCPFAFSVGSLLHVLSSAADKFYGSELLLLKTQLFELCKKYTSYVSLERKKKANYSCDSLTLQTQRYSCKFDLCTRLVKPVMVQNQVIFIFPYLHPEEAFSSEFLCAFQLNFAIASVVLCLI